MALSDELLHERPALEDIFEEEVLNVAHTDKVPPLFNCFAENLAKVSRKLCFVKTRFHHCFVEKINNARDNYGDLENIVGIQGIGKSSSTLYYVLNCRKEGDEELHYVDLKFIEKFDKNFEKFTSYAENIDKDDCLIIDHVTLFNMDLVTKINELKPVRKVILIETGFTASRSKHSFNINKDNQLEEDDFVKIWERTLSVRQKSSRVDFIKNLGHQVYSELKGKFIVTPRLLHCTMGTMLISDTSIEDISYSTFLRHKKEIAEFKKKLDESQIPEYEPFILHTRLLLDCFLSKSEVICTELQVAELNIAINIFDVKKCVATKQDFLDDDTLLELELEEGTRYKRISLLEPQLGQFWRQSFPFEHSRIHHFLGLKAVLEFYLRNGNIRKTLEKLLVVCQVNCSCFIVPEVVDETQCLEMLSGGKIEYHQSNEVRVIAIISKNLSLSFLQPTLEELKEIAIDEECEGHAKNIYRAALFLKTEVEKKFERPLIVYPKVSNLMGFDYFIYSPPVHIPGDIDRGESSSDPIPQKKRKVKATLYLVQVATGASHSGNTMGKAMPIFKEVLTDVVVHIIVMIVRKEKDKYTLTGNHRFSNISVINLAEPSITKLLQDESLSSLIESLQTIQVDNDD